MVFPGRFSTGCLRCRQRKVKCDETKPSCRRCSVYGKSCPGYTDQFHFRHSQDRSYCGATSSTPDHTTTTSKGRELERRNISSSRRGSCRDQAEKRDAARNRPPDPNLLRGPEACYDDVSLFYFIRRFVSPKGSDGFPGHLTFLPSLYDYHSRGLLEMATLSVAQMATYNQVRGEEFRVQSYRNYGRAIRLLQNIIQSEDQMTDDKVIMSILLLCTLKDISGEGSGELNEHAAGLFYLVEKRGLMQTTTTTGAELLHLALIRLQIHAFVHGDETYSDPGAIATAWGALDPLFRATSIMSRILSLRHSLLSFCLSIEAREAENNDTSRCFNDDAEQQKGELAIAECFKTLEEFDSWDTDAAKYWQDTFEGRRAPTALGEVSAGTTFYDAETACTIILFRSARLILLMSMIVYYSRMQNIGGNQRSIRPNFAALADRIPALEQDVGKTIDDILSGVPFAVGDVDQNGVSSSIPYDGAAALVIVHSIRLVAICAYATIDQRQNAIRILTRFNTSIGIKSAVKMEYDDIYRSKWAHEQLFLAPMASATLGKAFSPLSFLPSVGSV